MSRNQPVTAEQRDDGSSVAWWNPLHWPAAIWVLLVAFVVMSIPFAIRTIILAGIPDIPEPFDVVAFSKWEVAASDDAFTDYRHAASLHQQLLVDLKSPGAADAREPEDYQVILENGWSEASDSTKIWVELHQEALQVWRRGTEKNEGLNLAPSHLSFTTNLNVVQDQRMFARLAMLEEARLLSEGKFEEAYQWARASFRAGGHTSRRGPMIQGLVGVALHTFSSRGSLDGPSGRK